MPKPSAGFNAGGISTLEEKKQLGIAVLEVTALPVRLFMRSHVGYQRLSLIKIYVVFGLLMLFNAIGNMQVALPFLGNVGAAYQSESLRNFAFVFLAWSLITRRERYKEFKSGIVHHGYDGGTSHFEFLSPFIRREWIYRFIDPLSAFAVGYLAHAFFSGLGTVLMVSSASFGLIESVAHSQAEEALWSQRNNSLDAEVLADMVASTEQSGATPSPAQPVSFHSARETQAGFGLPTGADDALADAIHARRKASGTEEPRESSTIASKDNVQAARELLASWIEAVRRLPMAIKAGVAAGAILLMALVFSGQHPAARQGNYARDAFVTRSVPLTQRQPATQAPVPIAIAPANDVPAVNPSAMTAATPPGTPSVSTLAALVGFWQGSGELPPARGACTLKFELRSDPSKDGEFLGYSSLACGPPMSAMFGKNKLTLMQAMAMQHGLNPASAILHGTSTAKDSAIGFEVSKTIGVGQGAVCAMTSASLTPFGVGQVSFDWKETGIGCNGGQMLLARARQ